MDDYLLDSGFGSAHARDPLLSDGAQSQIRGKGNPLDDCAIGGDNEPFPVRLTCLYVPSRP